MDTQQQRDQQMVETAASDQPKQPALPHAGAARRRIGLGLSGLILTVASKPGMANGTYCGSCSGWHSATHASHANKDGGSCTGRTAKEWKAATKWPACVPSVTRSTMFSKIYPEGRQHYTDGKLSDVLDGSDVARSEFVTAYLNAAAKYNTLPTCQDLQVMWAAFIPNRTLYIKSTGVILAESDVVKYLAAGHS